MKKSAFIALFLLAVSPCVFSTDFFNDLDMVYLGMDDGSFDSYVIGDGSQSFTEQRWVSPFLLNRYETTK